MDFKYGEVVILLVRLSRFKRCRWAKFLSVRSFWFRIEGFESSMIVSTKGYLATIPADGLRGLGKSCAQSPVSVAPSWLASYAAPESAAS